MVDDLGDTGGEWTADWRTIHNELTLLTRLQLDRKVAALKDETLALDQNETAQSLARLQRSLERLEAQAGQYARGAERLRKEIATFLAAVHTYRSTWTPPAQESEWRVDLGLDDDAVEAMANLYRRQGRYL